jgi:hypothetical protein
MEKAQKASNSEWVLHTFPKLIIIRYLKALYLNVSMLLLTIVGK